jgi:hypothetical protein
MSVFFPVLFLIHDKQIIAFLYAAVSWLAALLKVDNLYIKGY